MVILFCLVHSFYLRLTDTCLPVTGVLQQLPFSDGIGRALQGAPSLWRTLRSVIGPYISPQAPHIAIAAFSVGASAEQTYRIANSASHMALHSGRSNVKVRRLVTNKNKLSKMLGGLKDTLAWLVGQIHKLSLPLRDIHIYTHTFTHELWTSPPHAHTRTHTHAHSVRRGVCVPVCVCASRRNRT